MFLTRTQPTELPFEFAELKQHCRVDADYTDDDAILEMYAWAAIKQGEFSSNRVWVESEWTGELTSFPRRVIEIPKSPCTEVSSIGFMNAAGARQTVPDSEYVVSPSSLVSGGGRPYAMVTPVAAWPQGSNVDITFKAGWAKGSFPRDLMEWVFVKVSSHYEQREDLASATRKIAIAFPRHFVDSLLDAYYLPRF
ncbi:phage gp6-like head-tail connector protein [Desulfovibrio sp. OttesenSCG-928-A18]|nr:phage gp6-like head-tail connector protein [Desulfovibrio sp. OttesenSCG-928-A18]